MECITLPVLGMEAVPYSEFAPLGKKEAFIRREKEISQLIRFYLKFKELVGKEEALMMFCDGRGSSYAQGHGFRFTVTDFPILPTAHGMKAE